MSGSRTETCRAHRPAKDQLVREGYDLLTAHGAQADPQRRPGSLALGFDGGFVEGDTITVDGDGEGLRFEKAETVRT